MKLGFHYHIPFLKKEDGSFFTSGAIGVFIDSLSYEFEKIYCFLHTATQSDLIQMDYKLQRENIVIIEIGPHDLFLKRMLRGRKIRAMVQPYINSIDLMLVRGPSPLLPLFSSICTRKMIPLSFLLVGDYVKSLQGASVKCWKRAILKTYYAHNKKRQSHYAKQALVLVNSRVLYNEYRAISVNLQEVRTTTLTKESFFVRTSPKFHNPVKLLYTGRIEPAKGLNEVLEAMSLLQQEGISTELNVVGWEDKKGYIRSLSLKAEHLGLSENFVFHGSKKVGEELFSMYRVSDIFVVASKGNEGFPRTIWEAMANSLPVIASRIGSIPYFLKDGENVLLVAPGSVNDIVEKIRLMQANVTLRREVVKNALLIARNNTLENQAKSIKMYCEKFKRGFIRI